MRSAISIVDNTMLENKIQTVVLIDNFVVTVYKVYHDSVVNCC